MAKLTDQGCQVGLASTKTPHGDEFSSASFSFTTLAETVDTAARAAVGNRSPLCCLQVLLSVQYRFRFNKSDNASSSRFLKLLKILHLNSVFYATYIDIYDKTANCTITVKSYVGMCDEVLYIVYMY